MRLCGGSQAPVGIFPARFRGLGSCFRDRRLSRLCPCANCPCHVLGVLHFTGGGNLSSCPQRKPVRSLSRRYAPPSERDDADWTAGLSTALRVA
jgi:hypothetical protein